MSAAAAFLHRPTFRFFPGAVSSSFKSLESIHFSQIPASNLSLSSGPVFRKIAFRLGQIAMSELHAPSALGKANEGEGVRALEQEAFVDGSSKVRSDGLESTLNRLSKWLVAGLFGAVLLCRHDAAALWAAMGSVLNSGLSVILKRILNQERPAPTVKPDPGMPSSHAQSIFFTIMFVIISMVQWLGMNGLTLTVSGLVLACGSYFTWLRVSQQFHTISQVVVGAAFGAIFSVLWFSSWDAVVREAYISSLWVRIFVVLSAAGFCLGFLFYVIRYWLRSER